MLSPLANLEVLALSHNKLGGRFTAEVAAFAKLKELMLFNMGIGGKIGSTRTEWLRILFTIHKPFLAGQLPKHLPLSLETLQLGPDNSYWENNNKFDGGIPAEWGGLTNLKKLNVMKCGLDGKPLSTPY